MSKNATIFLVLVSFIGLTSAYAGWVPAVIPYSYYYKRPSIDSRETLWWRFELEQRELVFTRDFNVGKKNKLYCRGGKIIDEKAFRTSSSSSPFCTLRIFRDGIFYPSGGKNFERGNKYAIDKSTSIICSEFNRIYFRIRARSRRHIPNGVEVECSESSIDVVGWLDNTCGADLPFRIE